MIEDDDSRIPEQSPRVRRDDTVWPDLSGTLTDKNEDEERLSQEDDDRGSAP